jgi:hypothetical protein
LRGPNRGTAGQLGPPDAGVSFTGLPSANVQNADNEAIVPVCRSGGHVITTVSANGVHSLAVSSISAAARSDEAPMPMFGP